MLQSTALTQLLAAMWTVIDRDPATASRFIDYDEPTFVLWPPLVPNIQRTSCSVTGKGLAAGFEAARNLPCSFKTVMADSLVRCHYCSAAVLCDLHTVRGRQF